MNRRKFLKTAALAAGSFVTPLKALGATVTPDPWIDPYLDTALHLVQESTVIDTLGLITTDWHKLSRWRRNPDDFNKTDWELIRSAGVSIFHPAVALPGNPSAKSALAWMEKWRRFADFHASRFRIIYTPSDMSLVKQTGRIGILLGTQNSNHFQSADDVAELYAFGQRVSQLTYNDRNKIGYGCHEQQDRGLTPFGVRIVEAMRKTGMLIDISHCGPQTSLDALQAAGGGVISSHSNCRALVPDERRCKSDALICDLAAAGGILGITAISKFTRSAPPVTIEDLLDHFDHAVSLGGVQHLGLGSDAGIDGYENYVVDGLNDATRVYQLTAGLLRRGYSQGSIRLILGGNFQRVFAEAFSG